MKSTPFTKSAGSIGTGMEETHYTWEKGTNYAIFPDWGVGKLAIYKLLLGDSYRNKDITEAIKRYAPTKSGAVNEAYRKHLYSCTPTSCHIKKIKDFSEDELKDLVDGIIKMEGYKEGKSYRVR